MATGQYNHPLFGLVKFTTEHTAWVRGDPITFTDGFDTSDVTTVFIPQLKAIDGASGGKLKFHKRCHAQILATFEDIEKLGLMKHIKTCAGAFFPRLRKPTSGKLSKLPSNHSFGIAIDLNSDDGSLGASVAPVAPMFEKHGFLWGKAFKDPMHFEVEKFIDGASSSVQDVKVTLDDKEVDLGAKNISGSLYAEEQKIDNLPNVKVVKDNGKSVSIKGKSRPKTFERLHFGDKVFIPLPQLIGLSGHTFEFDNLKKIIGIKNGK